MTTLRSLADLGVVFAPSIVPVISDGSEIGHIVAHGDTQATAFDAAGRPLGVFYSRAAAEAAVRGASFQEIDR
ncbi:hypothetical protein QA649_19650 [Bradyrhizobium sp. CB1717]|uniref:hypothetical protein n=1 Tax=Bradyrhizobium sp. CB1717 TaxID=3039154 RepID=UPI0024B05C95|nr:hypothetical protein [Bradyrhizobium sp. CB1717]WFU28346.1 hypothetical protein QA649_19650 [Bradyrhizobium sp. CB1717]